MSRQGGQVNSGTSRFSAQKERSSLEIGVEFIILQVSKKHEKDHS